MSDALRSSDSSVWDHSRNLAKSITEQDRNTWSQLAWSVFKHMAAAAKNTTVCVPQLLSALTLFAEVADKKTRDALNKQLFAPDSPRTHVVPNTDDTKRPVAVADYVALWVKSLTENATSSSFHVARRLLVNVDYTKSYGFDAFSALNACAVDVKITQDDVDLPAWMTRTLKLYDQYLSIAPSVNPFHLWRKEETRTKYAKCPILASVSRVAVLLQMLDDERSYSVAFQPVGVVQALCIRGNVMAPLLAIPFEEDGELIQLPIAGDRLRLFVLVQAHSAAKIGVLGHADTFDVDMVQRLIEGRDKNIITLHSVFLPTFAVFPDEAMNLGVAMKQALPGIDSLFEPDGFGDLSFPGGEATASGSNTPSIQNWDYVGYVREREPQKAPIVQAERVADGTKDRLVNRPFELIVWDAKHSLPVYFSRIVHPGKVPDWFASRSESCKSKNVKDNKKK